MNEWASETDCTDRHTAAKLSISRSSSRALTASFISLIPHSLLCLAHSLYLVCWLRYYYAHTRAAHNYSLKGLLSFLSAYIYSLWIPLPGNWLCILPWKPLDRENLSWIMDQSAAGKDKGNWVTSGHSWIMPAWMWRNGVHHQRRCFWWAANCVREELQWLHL